MAVATKNALDLTQASDLYESDFYTWALTQADLIRAGKPHLADLSNLAEEVESLGREQAAKLRSAYRLIALHLLKMIAQPRKATKSWRVTIVRERSNVGDIIGDSPGLKPRREELFASAYSAARREAAAETGLPLTMFPIDPPFTREQAEDYFP